MVRHGRAAGCARSSVVRGRAMGGGRAAGAMPGCAPDRSSSSQARVDAPPSHACPLHPKTKTKPTSKFSSEEKTSGSRKLSSDHSSCRLFCSGVPAGRAGGAGSGGQQGGLGRGAAQRGLGSSRGGRLQGGRKGCCKCARMTVGLSGRARAVPRPAPVSVELAALRLHSRCHAYHTLTPPHPSAAACSRCAAS